MELVNPTGRDLSASGVQPRACYCGSTNGGTAAQNFVTGKGNDSCANCGCYCSTVFDKATYRSTATNTNRVSNL